MKVSRSKTQHLGINDSSNGRVFVQREGIEKVVKHKYLGSIIHSNKGCHCEVKKQVQTGCFGWRKATGVFCDRKVLGKMKNKLYQVLWMSRQRYQQKWKANYIKCYLMNEIGLEKMVAAGRSCKIERGCAEDCRTKHEAHPATSINGELTRLKL